MLTWWQMADKAVPAFSFQPFLERHLSCQLWSWERRRGWVEDGRLSLEMAIAELFSRLRNLAKCFLCLPRQRPMLATSPTATQVLDTDPVTAEHFIREAHYPARSYDVETSTGYIVSLHRIARPNAKRTVFFQHGMFDTSLGWVCSGVTDSLAFAAWDQGCDVWLGNCRSNPPRRHVNTKIRSDLYWRHSLNELGMEDIRAQIEFVHRVKCEELGRRDSDTLLGEGAVDIVTPYTLCIIGHSLGAAAVLIYLVTALRDNRSHHAHKVILMSPAGFHHVYPIVLAPLKWTLPSVVWFMERIVGMKGAPLMIPGSYARLFIFKLLQDAVQYPAVREFLQRIIRWLMNGDVSPWEFVMQLPHYAVASMPGLSFHSALHLIQLLKSGRFQLYDYGSPQCNMNKYQQSTPPIISAEYNRIDIPVHIVAGTSDGVIPPKCVRKHFECMLAQQVDVSYEEFEYGHLEFSHTVAHDLQSYVLERILM